MDPQWWILKKYVDKIEQKIEVLEREKIWPKDLPQFNIF